MIYASMFLLTVLIATFIIGFLLGLKCSSGEVAVMCKLSNKHMELFKLAVKWIKEPEKVANYLYKEGYKKIGVYGMSYLGDCLVDILRKNEIAVVCGIDRNAEKIYNQYITIYHVEDNLPEMDVIIVTVVGSYQQIKKEMENKMGKNTDIVSLEDILHM